MFEDFKKFALKGNIIDLASAVIIGSAFGSIVKSLVDDIIMPPIGYLLGNVDFSNLFFVIKEGQKVSGPYLTLTDATNAGAVLIRYGSFINTIASFLIVSISVFIVMKQISKLQKKQEATSTPVPGPSEEVKILCEIRDLLKK